MEKLYNKIDFVNNTTPALNATNLNRMSKGLDDLDNRVIDLAADIMEVGPAAEAAMEAAGTAAEAAETASGASETATGAAASAEGYASDAKNWAVGPSGTGTGTDTNNAKYWAEQAAGAVSGVSSFNGRTGVVLPQNGDYTASDVGAIASTDKGSNGGVAELDNSGKVPVSQLPAMGGASSGATGTAGLVPAPAIGDESKVLSGAGVWVPQSSGGAAISCIGYEETGSTCSNPNGYQIGDNFYKNGKFCTAIATISQGATFTLNTNYVEGTIADAITALNSGLTDVLSGQLLGQFYLNPVTKGITKISSSSGATIDPNLLSYTSDGYIHYKRTSGTGCYFAFSDPISLKGITQITLKLKNETYSSDTEAMLGIATTKTYYSSEMLASARGKTTITLNTSGFNSKYYISIMGYGGNGVEFDIESVVLS